MPFADLSTDARLHYIDTGIAENPVPIILVHGLLGTAELHFARIIDWLESDYRMVAPTLRGYGESTPKPRTFPYDFLQKDRDDVLALMDYLSIKQAHIMGYSDGGEVALMAAGTSPERFKSVTVWATVGYYGPLMRVAAQSMLPTTWITDVDKRRHGFENGHALISQWVHTVTRMIDAGGDVNVSFAKFIRAPLLMMLGSDDSLNPPEYVREIIDRAPNARLEMLDCGHAVHDEQWEEFKQIVGRFLKSVK